MLAAAAKHQWCLQGSGMGASAGALSCTLLLPAQHQFHQMPCKIWRLEKETQQHRPGYTDGCQLHYRQTAEQITVSKEGNRK